MILLTKKIFLPIDIKNARFLLDVPRLYDGYAEQRHLQDSYHLHTGRHLHHDYADSQSAFKALMDSGIGFAKAHKLTIGVALNDAQMAALTHDIIWLVKQPITVTTKDKAGNSSTHAQTVLVPKLYLKASQKPTGTL